MSSKEQITPTEPNPTTIKRPRGRPVGTTGKHKAIKPVQHRLSLWLTPEQVETAKKLGGGKTVGGVRKALDMIKKLILD